MYTGNYDKQPVLRQAKLTHEMITFSRIGLEKTRTQGRFREHSLTVGQLNIPWLTSAESPFCAVRTLSQPEKQKQFANLGSLDAESYSSRHHRRQLESHLKCSEVPMDSNIYHILHGHISSKLSNKLAWLADTRIPVLGLNHYKTKLN